MLEDAIFLKKIYRLCQPLELTFKKFCARAPRFFLTEIVKNCTLSQKVSTNNLYIKMKLFAFRKKLTSRFSSFNFIVDIDDFLQQFVYFLQTPPLHLSSAV